MEAWVQPFDAPKLQLHNPVSNEHPPTSFAMAYEPTRRRAAKRRRADPPFTCTPCGPASYDGLLVLWIG